MKQLHNYVNIKLSAVQGDAIFKYNFQSRI